MSGDKMLAEGHFVQVHLPIDGNGVLTPALVADVNKACSRAEESEKAVLVVDVRGEPAPGRSRMWPGDLERTDIQLVNQWEQALRRIERLGNLTIATVRGDCTGVALELLLTADYRLATSDFRIRLKGPSGEIWPGMHVFRLAHQVGIARSRRVVLFGAELSKALAVELGLVDDVNDNLDSAVQNFIGSLGRDTAAELTLRRRLLLDATTMIFEDAVGVHLAACDRMRRRASLATTDGAKIETIR